MNKMLAIRHHEYGDPAEVLRAESLPIPQPERGQVRVRLLAATLNPSDYGMIGGSYGRLRELPAVAGREAIGQVDALGRGVTKIDVGARVRFPEGGSWQEYACISADELFLVDAAVPLDLAAISFINPPTAYCLLTKIVDLPKGSWVLQNAGNSAVGLSVIQMARAMGLKTINQVRREELVEPLKKLGADQVVVEGSDWFRELKDLTDGGTVSLALNSIGGDSAVDQIKALEEGGTQVTFGGMVGDKVRFPTRFLIFNDVKLVGFWWDRFCQSKSTQELHSVMASVYSMMRDGSLNIPIAATYRLDRVQEAIAHDRKPKLGKVLLKP